MKYSLSFFVTAVLAFAFVSCNKVSSRKDLEKVTELEARADKSRNTANLENQEVDRKLLRELGEEYVRFADKYPEAPESPEFLFRAGELYSTELQDYNKAIEVFDRNYKGYPEHETGANALFFIGYLYHNSLNDLIKAEKYYKDFLAKYPGHSMAKHARFELESLGMSVEEVFEKIINAGPSGKPDSIGGK